MMRPQARRFITLVDTLYDHKVLHVILHYRYSTCRDFMYFDYLCFPLKVKLVCTAEGSPAELFRRQRAYATNDETRILMDDLGINQV